MGLFVLWLIPVVLRAFRLLQLLDFVFIDTEHTPIDRTTLAWMCKAYAGINAPTIVRIPTIDPNQATQVIDAGAAGVIAPYIETPEQGKRLSAKVL